MKPVREGLTWLDEWVDPFEGAYTRLGKLFSVNAVARTWFVESILGVDSRLGGFQSGRKRWSCLDTRWAGVVSCEEPRGLAPMVLPTGLEDIFGPMVSEYASDEHFRYCPICLGKGFQSVLCQIDGLRTCPVHEVALLTECRHCRHRTGPYAINSDLVRNPLICRECGEPLSRAWQTGARGRWRLHTADDQFHKYGDLSELLKRFKTITKISTASWDMHFEMFRASERRAANLALALASLGVTGNKDGAAIPACLPQAGGVALTPALRLAARHTARPIDLDNLAAIPNRMKGLFLDAVATDLGLAEDARFPSIEALKEALSHVDIKTLLEKNKVYWVGDGDPRLLACLLWMNRIFINPYGYKLSQPKFKWVEGVEVANSDWKRILSLGYDGDLWFAGRWIAMTRYMDFTHWEWRSLLSMHARALGAGEAGSFSYSMAITSVPTEGSDGIPSVNLTFALGCQCSELPPVRQRTEASVKNSSQQPVSRRIARDYW